MGKQLISLDLGSKNLHLVCGSYKNGVVQVDKAVLKPISEGILKDGKIEDFHVLVGSIKNLIAENKIKTKNMVLTVQSTSVITRDITLPTTKHSELDSMIKFEIEQYLPIVSNEYVIEYTLLEEVVEEDVKKSRVQVAAMPKNMVDNYLNLVKELDLKPIALDIHSNAAGKLFARPTTINGDSSWTDNTISLIDIGFRSINIHIISRGKLAFSRIITLGSRELDSDIAVAFNLSLEEAERKKIKEASLEIWGYDGNGGRSCNDLVRAKLDIWLSEIQKIFQYYISRSTGNKIDSIYVYGGTSKTKGLPKYVEQSLSIKTSMLESVGCIKHAKSLSGFVPTDFINALGGLIRYE